jgi:antitoxin FitA
MAAVTIRNIPEATHRALKARAEKHGRSTEAEIREIIESAVRPSSRVRLGSALAKLGREYGGIELAIERDQSPAPPVRL